MKEFKIEEMSSKIANDLSKFYLSSISHYTNEDCIWFFYNWNIWLNEDGELITDYEGDCVVYAEKIQSDWIEVMSDHNQPLNPETIMNARNPKDYVKEEFERIKNHVRNCVIKAIKEWHKEFERR